MEETMKCCLCDEKHPADDIHHVDINGSSKKICKECAAAIKGLA